MSAVAPVNVNGGQTCPHGMPAGSCPICSGMGGGGRKTQRYSNPKQTMSYSEMVAIWHRMQAAAQRKEDAKADLIKQAENILHAKQLISGMLHKLSNVLSKISNMLPDPIANAFKTVINNVLQPLASILQKIPELVKDFNQFVQNIKAQLFVAAEKLASVFGEIKNFIQKSLSESFKRVTKKAYKILNLFGLITDEDFEEDERINTEIYAFKVKDIKTLKEILFRKIISNNQEENEEQ